MKMKSTLILLLGIVLIASLFGAGFNAYAVPEKSRVETTKIVLVFDQSLTVPSSLTNYVYLTSFDTNGFKNAYIMAKGDGSWQQGANINIWIYENNFGVRTPPSGGFGGYIQLATGSDTYKPDYGCGKTSDAYVIHSTSTDLYLQVYNSDVGFDGQLTIVVYLTN